jgi:CspA family cold shock protein
VVIGKVTSWKAERGYGFIKPDAGGVDVFLHVAELLPGNPSSRIADGVRVEYEQLESDRGPKAVRVRFPLADFVEVRPAAGAVTAEQFGRDVTGILDDASMRIQQLALRYGWTAQ